MGPRSSEGAEELKGRLGRGVKYEEEKESIGYDVHQAYLELMLRHVVIGDPETNSKRSNSVIIYGLPGSGKSTLVESTLGKLNRECKSFASDKMVVRLSGILCPDLKIAVEEICFQLKFENCEGAEGILCDMENAANFDDRLEQTMGFLRTNMESLNKSVIFILDKIERFAEHPNQALLYNLFDLCANSSSTIPLLVVGISDRVDVLELFEKRVKSRFSHRQINLSTNGYNFQMYKTIAQRLMTLKVKTQQGSKSKGKEPKDEFQVIWNGEVDSLMKNVELNRILQCIYDTDKSILQLVSYLFSVCCLVEGVIQLGNFQKAFEDNFRCDYATRIALDLPISELIVLLAVYKQLQNNKQQAWQPSSLYKIVDKIILSFGLGKDDYLKSVSRLEMLELIVPISNSQRNAGGVGNIGEMYFKSELTISELQEIWKKYPQLPSSFQELL